MLPTSRQASLSKSANPRTDPAGISRALEWLWQHLQGVRRPHILDCGPVQQSTVDVLLRRGAKLYVADLVSPAQRGDAEFWDRSGKTPSFRLEAFLAQVPPVPPASLSAVFGWQILDLLPRETLPKLIERLWPFLQPGGLLFFLLREPRLTAGAETLWWLEGLNRLATGGEGIKPFPYAALTNREMEKLVPAGSVKTFLTRAGRREALAIK